MPINQKKPKSVLGGNSTDDTERLYKFTIHHAYQISLQSKYVHTRREYKMYIKLSNKRTFYEVYFQKFPACDQYTLQTYNKSI